LNFSFLLFKEKKEKYSPIAPIPEHLSRTAAKYPEGQVELELECR